MALGQFGLTTNGSASDLTITIAGTYTCTAITGLTGMQSLGLWYKFVYGSGGTSVRAYKQTSLDGGNTWIDIACRLFTTANATGLLNFSALTPKTTEVVPTDGALADNTAIDGILGDRSRYKVVVVGTYGGNTLFAARMVAR
ncbi:MAG TPA: hypothetical protein VII92_10315 [Anaerolineae bacterium]